MNERVSRVLSRCPVFVVTGLLLGLTGAVSLADPIEDPDSMRILPGIKVELVDVVDGMTAPNLGVTVPGHNNLLMVSDQNGIIWQIDLTTNSKSEFLDLGPRLTPLGFTERGLLGLAFHPLFESNGLFYTYTSEPLSLAADFPSTATDPDHDAVITEFHVLDPQNPGLGIDSEREIMRIEQPQSNHNAGSVVFGPDDMLYIALGDGGGSNDVGDGHSEIGNGQDTSNILGAILRIDPLGDNATNGQYGIPEDNPFTPENGLVGGMAGCGDGFCDEIFAHGLRNPFRISFDSAMGTLFAADAGQEFIEEVNVISAGGNYGWNIKEGPFCFDPSDGSISDPADCPSQDLLDPNAWYDHDEGVVVIGGFVYRGTKIPALRGRYVFGDFTGSLFHLWEKDLQAGEPSTIKKLRSNTSTGGRVLGFGQDARGELYVMGNALGIPFGSSGFVKKLIRIDRSATRSTEMNQL